MRIAVNNSLQLSLIGSATIKLKVQREFFDPMSKNKKNC